MMLRALRANDVVPTAQMKKSKSCDLDFLAGVLGLEPRTRGFGGSVAQIKNADK